MSPRLSSGGSHHAFTVGTQTFTIVKPSKGNVKPVYGRTLLRAMEELELYEPEER
jgi:hypothetical protein